MKKILYLFCAFILFSGSVFSQQSKDELKYLNFDMIYPDDVKWSGDTALVLYDKSPSAHNIGYFYGKKSDYLLVPGKIGEAVKFDSTGIAISINPLIAASLNHPAYADSVMTKVPREKLTIAAWIKSDKPLAEGYQHIIGWGAGSGINIFIKNGTLQVETESLPDDDKLGLLADNTTLNLKTNWTYGSNWTHVAAAFNHGLLQLLVNGEVVASDTVRGYKDNADFNNNILTVVPALKSVDGEGWSMAASFGWKPYDQGLNSGYNKFANFFFGSIDELRIYNVALDTSEINLLPGLKPGLQRYYDYETLLASDSLLVRDSSPFHHDLLLFNGAKSTYSLVPGKIGQAMKFDGVSNGLALTTSSFNASVNRGNENYYDQTLNDVVKDEFTIAAWIKVAKPIAAGFQHIIGFGSGSGINAYIKNQNLFVDVQNHAKEDLWGFGNTTTVTSIKNKWTYGTGWNHVAIMFKKGYLSLRINGTLVASDTVIGFITIADFNKGIKKVFPYISSIDGEGWSVGAAFGWKPYDHAAGQEITVYNKFACFFTGTIDDLRMYDYVLDSAQYCDLPGGPCLYLGTNNIKAENNLIQIYPNPATNILNIKLKTTAGAVRSLATVYNQLGVLINSYWLKDGITSINLSEYKNEIYFIRINSGGTIRTQKFIVTK